MSLHALASRRMMLVSLVPVLLLAGCLVLILVALVVPLGTDSPEWAFGLAWSFSVLALPVAGLVSIAFAGLAVLHAVMTDGVPGEVRIGVLLVALLATPFAYFAYWVVFLRPAVAGA